MERDGPLQSRRRWGGACLITPAGVVAREIHAGFGWGNGPPANDAGEPALADETLHRFVDAVHEIATIRETIRGRMATASPLQRRLLRARARRGIARALAAQGLTHAQYRTIGALLERDGDLGQSYRCAAPCGRADPQV